jgi:hypothetical protein
LKPGHIRGFISVRFHRSPLRNARSSSHLKLESAVRAAVGNLAPGLNRDGYDRAMNYIGIWRALKSQNRRLYKRFGIQC